jgi:hypothetical protein
MQHNKPLKIISSKGVVECTLMKNELKHCLVYMDSNHQLKLAFGGLVMQFSLLNNSTILFCSQMNHVLLKVNRSFTKVIALNL